MKTIFKIHFLFYLVAFICFITGNFKIFVMFTTIIIVHELGHIIGGLLFKWNLEKIILLPFGGITIFKENLNKPLIQEFIITILGPLFQCSLFLINDLEFITYNKFILLFNLLPIIPLDGSKIINILSNLISSFYKSRCVNIYFSIITLIFVVLFYKINLLFILVTLFLLKEIITEVIKNKFYFNKFLLERYLYRFNFKHIKYVKGVKEFKKGKKHLIYSNGWQTEREILTKMFDK